MIYNDIMKKNGIDNAWVYVGTLAYPRTTRYGVYENPIVLCKKFSNLDFEMMMDSDNNEMMISGFGRFSTRTENSLVIDAIFSPKTMEVEIEDVIKLHCKTPLELFMKLELMDLVLFQ